MHSGDDRPDARGGTPVVPAGEAEQGARYEKREDSGRIEIDFGAGVAAIDRACADVRAFLEAQRLSSSCAFELTLVLREALANAVVHGSAQGEPVRLAVTFAGDEVSIAVQDGGPGFDWRRHGGAVPPPEVTSGRGLSIMKSYADEVSFNERGNAVYLRKKLRQKGACMSAETVAGNEVKVALDTDVIASTVGALKERLKALVEQGSRQIVLDCKAVEVIDSMGIGLLVATHNSLAKSGGRLVLVNASEAVCNLLRTMRLDKHFSVNPA